ncbi:unnamed protein product [Laminaria digitata]
MSMCMLPAARICCVPNALAMLRSPLSKASSSASGILRPREGSMLLSTGSGRTGVPTRRKSPPPPVQQLLDGDIEERFVKGSGPGGQKINKVRNCVQLTHRPTGISVSCQDSRELTANRHIARKRLREKVDFHLMGDESKTGRRIAKIRNKKARSQRKSRLKHQGKAAEFPEGEGKAPPGRMISGDADAEQSSGYSIEDSFEAYDDDDSEEDDSEDDGGDGAAR